MKVVLLTLAACACCMAAPALAATGQCQCRMSVISGATGLTLTSGPIQGPCGRPMGVGKVAQLQLSSGSAAVNALGVVSASAFQAVTNAASNTDVAVEGSSFNPNSVTINQGDTVTWHFDSGGTHTVTANDFSFDSGFQSFGTFSHTYNDTGTFGYYCQLHGSPGSGMAGEVIVNAVVATPEPVAAVLLLPAAVLLGRRRRR